MTSERRISLLASWTTCTHIFSKQERNENTDLILVVVGRISCGWANFYIATAKSWLSTPYIAVFVFTASFVPLVRLQSPRKLPKFFTTLTSLSLHQFLKTPRLAKTLQKLQLLNENWVQSTASHLFAGTRSLVSSPNLFPPWFYTTLHHEHGDKWLLHRATQYAPKCEKNVRFLTKSLNKQSRVDYLIFTQLDTFSLIILDLFIYFIF